MAAKRALSNGRDPMSARKAEKQSDAMKPNYPESEMDIKKLKHDLELTRRQLEHLPDISN